MEPTDYESRLKLLEKTVRILQKKLDRSEADRQQLENASELRESLLKSVIRELEESQISLEKRGNELETALANLKALQMKLVESEKMSALGVLVAGIAHEINNPVSFIYGNLNYAHEYFQDLLRLVELYQHYYPEPVAVIKREIQVIELEFIKQDSIKLFQSMNIGAERITEIVKSLRTFSRLDEADFKSVDIHEGIDSTLIILNNRLKASVNNPNGIKIIKNYGNLPLIECYSGQMNQVFMNIFINAIDALEESLLSTDFSVCNKKITSYKELVNNNPQIQISTDIINNDWVEIRIADNGLGMDDKVKVKLFDPFFTTKDVGKGTGLGLSISYRIINELHGGKLYCHSSPGAGADFVIHIPIRQSKIK
ncbi:sensor histidine kinase [Nostocaceae cyanobacterium CENA357]|uniref:histidine kinase n=1 Tax=Atlanticothrix silvestris CENA357 TaxID=1725252 RepID=A0A8J7L7F4_9CYAN|nr:ATP-binding protein [Atlanticothrix silvestris]MBH8555052.1 sensor histidine kinase [Atlanticothrix silvestris CENA357]